MGNFCMPSLGADMEFGTLVEWLVEPGSRVQRGDIIATVETQKGLFEVEVFEEGILGEPLIHEGEEVPVGTVLAVITTDASPQADGESRGGQEKTISPAPSLSAANETNMAAAGDSRRIQASPSARRLAVELGIDLGQIQGGGSDGIIHLQDVERAMRQAPNEPQRIAAANTGGTMRQAIAAAMSLANREIPHYYLENEMNLSLALGWLETENRRKPIQERLLPVILLLKAVALALRDVPELNGYWQDNQLQIQSGIHIGFALALRHGGVVTPAIHDVDRLSLLQLMQAVGDMIERSRTGRLRSSEMTEGTVTVTNLGDRGVKTVFGIIYPPQVALVSFGRITERPWVELGNVVVCKGVTVTLAGDHRATDGHTGALFLEALNRYLQQPESL